ncbi:MULTISPECIES: HNH endonuclease [Vibrio]|uniref:HNH endonuclease n=1 Tax=Vibrio TaxID=662 RepID=UPI000C84D5B4|nr:MULTISPECIES: HNH endonuclease [Vibrio]NOJ09962.1 HNH endonuclease [Vibrio splendidus]PME67382.1 hypothetical protein BCV31_11425 [Vibrio cyclitrophicus]PMK96616.1 hypothetical protein BCT87_08960 [Vibrio cyclitrophicus]
MRPVNRGAVPQKDGVDKIYSTYQKARGDLIKRIGEYCSYCEMQLDTNLAVEHVLPKKPKGSGAIIQERLLDWDNFLLACTNCNSHKGNANIVLADFVWPDTHNTFKALTYKEGGIVEVAGSINSPTREKIDALIELVGLKKRPSLDHEASDRRWNKRRVVWDKALRARDRLQSCDSEEMREQIIEHAEDSGFWSVWMTVFQQDPDMLRRLLYTNLYKGTATEYFDHNGAALVRVASEV